MRPHSRQILTVEETFGKNGWHCEFVEGRDVLRAGFEAHHTRVDLIAQAHPQINALAEVAESPMPLDEEHTPVLLELLARANKQLTLGGFEYDLDRSQLVFRITNLFEREVQRIRWRRERVLFRRLHARLFRDELEAQPRGRSPRAR